MPRSARTPVWNTRWWRAALRAAPSAVILGLAAAGASAQDTNPVYVDDSTRATETLDRLPSLIASGNLTEAARAVQRVIGSDGDRVVSSPGVERVYIAARERLRRVVADNPELLERYRTVFGTEAERRLGEAGDDPRVLREVAANYALTSAGFDASVRLARVALWAGEFDAALLTLERLLVHPDAGGESSPDAASLAISAARYADRTDAWSIADAWRARIGEGPAPRQPIAPPPALLVDRGPSSPNVQVDRLVSRPLRSVSLLGGDRATWSSAREVGNRVASTTLLPWIVPSVVGDRVYVNDGIVVGAWDRFTLEPVWRAVAGRVAGAPAIRGGRINDPRAIEDLSTVAVDGRLVVAVTGLAALGERQGDPRVHAFDRATGDPLWTVDPAFLDADLAFSSVRGSPLIVGDLVILALRKADEGRRLVSVRLVALDRTDGSLVWSRPLGSIGSQYQSRSRDSDGMTLHAGVIYRADEIGVIAAIDAATGAPRWVRRERNVAGRRNDGRPPAEENRPIVLNGSVFTLSPDRARVLELDARTGAVRGERPANAFADARYLLKVGDRLVGVGPDRLAAIPIEGFNDPASPAEVSERLHEVERRGRAIAAGSRVLVPIEQGVAVVDPANGLGIEKVSLDHSGNLAGHEGQLLVADGSGVHSYLIWDTAAGLLRDRIDSKPQDPDPAITLADLAFRAGEPDEIMPALDTALEIIGRDAATDSARAARERLFGVVRAMIEPATEPDRVDRDEGVVALVNAGLVGDALDRLARAIDTPEQTVVHRLALGRLRVLQSDPAGAIEAYQEVLGDPRLADADWTGGRLSVRAGLESTRRVRDLVTAQGVRLYAPFDAVLEAERAWLPGNASGDDLAALARRFPAAGVGPALWLDAARAYDAESRHAAAQAACRSGVESAAFLVGAGGRPEAKVVGELLAFGVDRLLDAGRAGSALALVQRVGDRFESLPLTIGGEATDLASLREHLRGMRSGGRLPRIGAVTPGDAQLLPGWTLLEPIRRASTGGSGGPTDAALMFDATESSLALFAGGLGDEFAPRWTVAVEHPPQVLAFSTDSVDLLLIGDTAGQTRIERRSLATGALEWSTTPAAALFANAGPAPNRAGGLMTAHDGRVRPDQVLVAHDGTVIAMVERSGRAGAFDAQTGQTLWSRRVALEMVSQVALHDGSVVVAGREDEPVPGAGRPGAQLIALDARTGEPTQRLQIPGGEVHWLRSAESGLLIVGVDRGVLALDPQRARVEWEQFEGRTENSLDAWVFGDRLFVLESRGVCSLLDAATGAIIRSQLRTDGRFTSAGGMLAFRGADDTVVFAGTSGVVAYTPSGLVAGMDAIDDATTMGTRRDAAGTLLTPAPAEGLLITVEIEPIARTPGGGYRLHALTPPSARLVQSDPVRLYDTPRSIGIVDDRVLISTSRATLVLPAPAP